MRPGLTSSLFFRQLWSVTALVLSAVLLISAAAVYLLPPGQDAQVIPIFGGLTLLILALMTGVIYLFARSVTDPLSELARATRAVARGELETPLTIDRKDEIGALADDFREMQRELVASRRALEAEKARYAELNELKERLLANIPHEIKTPLAAVAASLELIREENPPLSDEQRRLVLDSLQRSVVRLEYLVDNMLDAASIQAGQFRIRPEATALAPILEEARLFIQPLLDQKDQRLRVENRAGRVLVRADPARVVQVLVNLLSNASKYGDPGSSIDLTAIIDGACVRVAVHNTGSPVPPADRERLFQRFGRTANAEGLSGVGLGLAISRTIVELHGGEIGLDCSDESGTVVSFTLPCAAGDG